MVRPHLKWLSLPLAFATTLGAWAAPADAGVIPWVYNAIFGPARNGPYGAMYGGGAFYGPRVSGRTFARYGGYDMACGYGGCGVPSYGYGASYGVPVYGGYDAGCNSCGSSYGSYGGGCSTGTCGSSYYSGGYAAPMSYGYVGAVGNCANGCGVAGTCAPNAPAGLAPVPQNPGYPAGGYPAGGYPPAGGFAPQSAPAANPGFPAGAPMSGGNPPSTYAPDSMNTPAGSNRTAPGSGFTPTNPATRNPLSEETGGGFKPTTPFTPATPVAPGTGASSGAAPAAAPATPAAVETPAKPASNGTKPPSVLGEDDVNVGPVAREEKVARVTFGRMKINVANRDARLVRVDPAPQSASLAIARK
jgi:hypothetical protein